MRKEMRNESRHLIQIIINHISNNQQKNNDILYNNGSQHWSTHTHTHTNQISHKIPHNNPLKPTPAVSRWIKLQHGHNVGDTLHPSSTCHNPRLSRTQRTRCHMTFLVLPPPVVTFSQWAALRPTSACWGHTAPAPRLNASKMSAVNLLCSPKRVNLCLSWKQDHQITQCFVSKYAEFSNIETANEAKTFVLEIISGANECIFPSWPQKNQHNIKNFHFHLFLQGKKYGISKQQLLPASHVMFGKEIKRIFGENDSAN